MGKNNKKKLALKKETVRKLDALSNEQLKDAAGGALYAYNYNFYNLGGATLACAGWRPTGTATCTCEPTGGCF